MAPLPPDSEEVGQGPGESTPLLSLQSKDNNDLEAAATLQAKEKEVDDYEYDSNDGTTSLWKDELKAMTDLALPVIGTYVLEMLPGLVSIVLVGHISVEDGNDEESATTKIKQYIDATALSVMYMNLTGLSIGMGLATAMDTLCSQAYGASATYKMGTYLQTGIIVLMVFTLGVSIMFYYCEEILLALGQPPVVSKLAGSCTWLLLPGVPFIFVYEVVRKIFQSTNLAYPLLVVSMGANLINLGFGYYLTFYTNWGWLGVSLARTISNISFIILILPYLFYWKNPTNPQQPFYKSFWTGLHIPQALKGIPQFLTLGIPGMFQLCFEWWAFELLAVICGWFSNAVVAIGANAVILNIASVVYMLYLGLSISCNVRVGNALGGNEPKRATTAATLGMILAVGLATVTALVLYSTRQKLPALLTNDPDINQLASRLIIVAAVFQIPDSVNGTVQGIFRGSGRQYLGAWLNFAAYYLLGIPLALILAFVPHWGVVGLWIGMTAALLVVAIGGTILVCRSDWNSLAMEAQKRLSTTSQPPPITK